MKYFFNGLRKMDLQTMRISQALRIFKFHYINGKLEKKEYKYLVKNLYKNKKEKKY